MSKLSQVALHLLGTFAVEANVGRPIRVSIRSRKARALLAYVAMKPDHRARREELATLFWGDNPDALARHNLRQCLVSMRHDLCLACEILAVDREAIGLRPELVSVDARMFTALARSAAPGDLSRAAAMWRGAFLPDLSLDLEEFDAWQRQEAERLAAAAAAVFDALCRDADAKGDGETALAAAERLVALEPTREDLQRTALKLLARYRGREAALSRVKQLTDLLRNELGVAPEAATRALIDAVKRGDFEPAPAPDAPLAVPSVVPPVRIAIAAPLLLPADTVGTTAAATPSAIAAAAATPNRVPTGLPPWRRRPRTAAWITTALGSIGIVALLGVAYGPKLRLALSDPPRSPTIAVLPFTADNPGRPDDPAFARILTHDLIGYLSRFGGLRVMSEQTSETHRDRQIDGPRLNTDDMQYAIVGHVQGNSSALRIDFQLVDTATRTNVWSDDLQRERSDPTVVADQTARGIARMLAIEIYHLGALRLSARPSSELTVGELVARGYLAWGRGTTRENLSEALTSFETALARNPHYQPALLAVARLHIVAAMNFIDLDPSHDLGKDEQLLNETLAKSPTSISALYSLALLQKYRHQYQASLQSLQRCLELNPSFLQAQGQIGDILTRIGQPQKGLEQLLQTIRIASPNDPSMGYWYLFAAEAELELGHDPAALDWAMRADAVMPATPLVQAWLASIYASIGDKPKAAKHVAALAKMAPARMRLFMNRSAGHDNSADGAGRPRIFDGLRLALTETPG